MGDDSEPERMFICASMFDRKITAHHWSVRHNTLLVLEEFLQVSMLAATTCALNELVEATYRGYTVLYRPFQRAGTALAIMSTEQTISEICTPAYHAKLRMDGRTAN